MLTTIAVLIVFFIILMFGFIFYTQVERISFERSQTEAEARRSIAVAQVVVNLPELQCSLAAGVEKGICFDLYKILAFNETYTNYWTYYYNMFGYAEINVTQINLEDDIEINYQIYKNTGDKNSSTLGLIPISIYNPIGKNFSFGVVEVRSYYE